MASSSMGMAWRASSRSRTLWRVAVSVSRSAARTRRSRLAAGPSASQRRWRPSGSTTAKRARASASIEFDLACWDRNRRSAAAFAELTRCTTCPRRQKNTATGSQAAPVGSMITSNRVPSGAPVRAAASIVARLSVVGRQRRRASTSVVSSITTTVWVLAMPRSIPTMRRVLIVVSFSSPMDTPTIQVLDGHGPTVASESPSRPHTCSSTGLDLTGRPTSLSGSSVAGSEEALRLPRHDHVVLSVDPPASPRTSRGPSHATPWAEPTGGPNHLHVMLPWRDLVQGGRGWVGSCSDARAVVAARWEGRRGWLSASGRAGGAGWFVTAADAGSTGGGPVAPARPALAAARNFGSAPSHREKAHAHRCR